MLYSGHDIATVIINSQKLWVTALGLHKTGHINSQTWMEEGFSALFNTAELFPTNRFGERGSHCLQLLTHQ